MLIFEAPKSFNSVRVSWTIWFSNIESYEVALIISKSDKLAALTSLVSVYSTNNETVKGPEELYVCDKKLLPEKIIWKMPHPKISRTKISKKLD